MMCDELQNFYGEQLWANRDTHVVYFTFSIGESGGSNEKETVLRD